MKKLLNNFFLLATIAVLVASCDKNDDDGGNNNTTLVELTGNLTTSTLTADKKYLIKGQVFINDGVTLTIEPGTVLFGDKATRGTLVVTKGGILNACGTSAKPIVFTSALPANARDRGDWGGLVILGRANVNQNNPAIEGITPQVNFGTTNDASKDGESSGCLKYVRVEFAGIELTPNNETNSITLGGVGRGTTMEYVQASFGGDDGFEWFGGAVNGKYLISQASWDDDFDVDYGFTGNVQFGLALRYPSFADQSQSNGFETDNGPNDNDVTPYTNGVFSNITVMGPIAVGSAFSQANYAHAIDLRRRTSLSIFNSVFTGFPIGVRMNQPSVYTNYQSGKGVLENNILLAPRSTIYAAGTGVVADSVKNYWLARNTTVADTASSALYTSFGINPANFYNKTVSTAYASNPDFKLLPGTLNTGAKFTNAKFSETNRSGYFENVPHIGAFGAAADWTDGWAEFNPIAKAY